METATKTPPRGATDRVLEALSTLAAFLDRTIDEVKGLDSDFQNRLIQAVQETETSLQAQAALHLEQALNETRTRLEEQLKNRIAELSTEWDAERTRLNAELNRVTQTAARWEAERARLNTELERLARIQVATQAEAEKAMAAARAAVKSPPTGNSEVLSKEVQRVESVVKEISLLIEDPGAELSTVIRKNVERAELEAYLKGIRYAINGGRSQ